MRALKSCLLWAGVAFSSLSFANQELEEFALMVSNQHGYEKSDVLNILQGLSKNQTILDAISSPWESKPWHQYYPIFLTEKRLGKGLAFWNEHEQVLARAEKETGVSAEIIVAILGIESFYGTYKGKYSVLESLYTLGFHYPPRQTFFRKELGEFFALVKEEKFDLHEVKGSYAGAMGWGQFISSSYRHYAVDFDGDGIRNLLTNPVDAIGSVANYFALHGWQAQQPVAFRASLSRVPDKGVLTKKGKHKHNWADLKASGVSLKEGKTLADSTKAKLYAFEQPDKKEYWVGLDNFYVITRYNHSPLYAMAVFQFSQQLRDAKQNQ